MLRFPIEIRVQSCGRPSVMLSQCGVHLAPQSRTSDLQKEIHRAVSIIISQGWQFLSLSKKPLYSSHAR